MKEADKKEACLLVVIAVSSTQGKGENNGPPTSKWTAVLESVLLSSIEVESIIGKLVHC